MGQKNIYGSFPDTPTKKELCIVSGMKTRKFSAFLKELEPEIIALYSRYNKNCSIVVPKVADFILAELGLTREDARRIYKESFNCKY